MVQSSLGQDIKDADYPMLVSSIFESMKHARSMVHSMLCLILGMVGTRLCVLYTIISYYSLSCKIYFFWQRAMRCFDPIKRTLIFEQKDLTISYAVVINAWNVLNIHNISVFMNGGFEPISTIRTSAAIELISLVAIQQKY